jgi:hypothetical protein
LENPEMAAAENSTTLSTLIPSIGMTFVEAADRVRDLVHEGDTVPNDPDGERCDELHAEWSPIRDTILTSQPQTDADVLAVLEILLHPSIGLATGCPAAKEVRAIQLIREAIAAGLAAPTLPISPQSGPQPEQLLSDLRRWLELENTTTPEGADESLALARKIAASGGDPVLGMAVKAFMLWCGHPDARDTEGQLKHPPAATERTSEEDALTYGLVTDALRAVPELAEMVGAA